MKKITALLLTISLVLLVAGCEDTSGDVAAEVANAGIAALRGIDWGN